MKTMKKFMCVLLVVLVCLSSAPLGGFDFIAEAAELKNGDIIEIGSYPQSEVTNKLLLTKLNELSLEWKSYGYYSGNGEYNSMSAGDWMKYADVEYQGEKYRAVYFEQYRPNLSYYTCPLAEDYPAQYGNGYLTYNVYWFKYEPIKWHIINKDEGLLISDIILDAQPYSNTIYRFVENGLYSDFYNSADRTFLANNYGSSSLCHWLNNSFYNSAFDKSKEKVYVDILKHGEAKNLLTTEERRTGGSDYAFCQGLLKSGNYADQSWWLKFNGESGGSNGSYIVQLGGHIDALWYHTTVCCTVGIRPIIVIDLCDFDDENSTPENPHDIIIDNTDNEKDFINQHLDFVKGTENFLYDKATNEFRFANTIWENMDSGIKNHAELAHDIIEGSLEILTLQFADGLKSGANPYEVILLDFLSSDVTQSYFAETAKEDALSIAIDIINDTIKMFDYEFKWSESFNLKNELKNLISASDYSGNHLYQSVNTFFYGKAKKEVKTVFESFECCGKLFDFLDAGLSVADFFVEMLRYTVAIEAFNNSAEAYKTILREISTEMYDVNNNYAEKFDSTLSFYEESLDYDSILTYVIENKGIGGGFNLIYKMTSSMLSKATYSMIMKIFKVGSSVAGQINASLWAAEVGFGLSNMLTGNDTLVNCRRLLRATYMLDVASYNVMKRFESVLIKNENYGAALLFDNAFSFYKNVQLYSVNTYKKYCETSSTKWLSFNKEHFKNELAATVTRIKLWNEYRCHFDPTENKQVADIDTVVVACPTDIYVYRKSDNKLVASVIDNISKSYTDEVAIICVDEEKALACDSIDDYKVEIVATGDGTMDVIYNSYSNLQNVEELSFSDIPINLGDSYVLDSDKEYVKRDDGVAYKENGSVEGCSCSCHAGGIKGFFFKIILFFQKIFKKNQVCACGIAHY